MKYNLIAISDMHRQDTLEGSDYFVAELNRPGTSAQTVKVEVDKALVTTSIRLSNVGNNQINIYDPIFDSVRDNLPDQLETQDDMNLLLTNTVTAVVNKVNSLPEVILSSTPPEKDDVNGMPRYHNEGTIWVDTNTFRSYVMFYNYDEDNTNPDKTPENYYWVGLTDR